MPYAKKTLFDLKQAMADKYSGGVIPTASATLIFWVRLLNEGQMFCAQHLGLVKPSTLTTSSGTIALPDDFISVDKVVDSSDVEYSQISQTDSVEASGLVYWITGDHSSGFYLNSPDDTTFTVYHTYRPADMSSDSDVCIIPDPLAVVCYAYGKLRKTESDPLEDADASLAEAESRIREMANQMQLNDQPLGFTFYDNA